MNGSEIIEEEEFQTPPNEPPKVIMILLKIIREKRGTRCQKLKMNFYGDILSCFEEKIKDVMENHVKMRPKYMEISSTDG